MTTDTQKPQSQEDKQAFRGILISITETGKLGIRVSGDIKPLEIYGALSLAIEQVRKTIEG